MVILFNYLHIYWSLVVYCNVIFVNWTDTLPEGLGVLSKPLFHLRSTYIWSKSFNTFVKIKKSYKGLLHGTILTGTQYIYKRLRFCPICLLLRRP